MKPNREVLAHGIMILVSACISFLPNAHFWGLSGEHWMLGWPLEDAMLKYGMIEIVEGSVPKWHLQVHYPIALFNVIVCYFLTVSNVIVGHSVSRKAVPTLF